jgi:phosphoenolpyruvate phosphomutase
VTPRPATLPNRPRLTQLLAEGRVLRALECHTPLSAMLGERARAGGAGFDLLWLSGFAYATMMGIPDAELLPSPRRLEMIRDIAAATHLPLLADGDTGGDLETCKSLCLKLKEMGVSGVVLEDKRGAKRTSLAHGAEHELEDPQHFAAKIDAAKSAPGGDDFPIFARIEALIAGTGQKEALSRARCYLQSRADGIVIHSKDRSGEEVFAFMEDYRALQDELGLKKPLVLIPTAYSHVTADALHARGAAIVIHANHMVRAAYKAMEETAQIILRTGRGSDADAGITPVADILTLLGTG